VVLFVSRLTITPRLADLKKGLGCPNFGVAEKRETTLRIRYCMHPVYPLLCAQGLKVYFTTTQRRNYGVDMCIWNGWIQNETSCGFEAYETCLMFVQTEEVSSLPVESCGNAFCSCSMKAVFEAVKVRPMTTGDPLYIAQKQVSSLIVRIVAHISG
jgi:hypothetical protein